jgi:catechol 2,3-dioxygenase-like lactoylglutathione lyase family enzyme
MVAWYERVLGLRVAERGRFDAVGAEYAMLDGPDFRVELISRGTPSARVDRTGPPGHLDVLGYKALVLDADDLAGATARMQGAGVEIVWADQPLSPDRRSTLIRDPEGNLVNIFGPAPSSEGQH